MNEESPNRVDDRHHSTLSSTLSSESSLGAGDHQECHSHMLHIHILKGCDLVARDTSGKSDPYVRIKFKDKILFKTRKIFQNLNPVWNEHFELPVDDLNMQLRLEVFDYDRIGKDDFMGESDISLSDVKETAINELKLMLKDDANSTSPHSYMGYVFVNLSLTPMTSEEDAQLRRQLKSSKFSPIKSDTNALSLGRFKKGGKHTPVYQVTIVLAEGRYLISPSQHRSQRSPPDPYVKLKVGSAKFRSKSCSKTNSPKWTEQFEFRTYCQAEQKMELDVLDRKRDDLIGKCVIELGKLPKCVTNQIWYKLENGGGEVLLLTTISAIKSQSLDEQSFETKTSEDIAAVAHKYIVSKTFEHTSDIGFLVVKVFKAVGLASADIASGKSDPFCVLELVNDRVQTSTVYKSLCPEWNQYFTFSVKDIHSALEVTVYDEDQNSEPEFLGKIGVPLAKICDGQKRWYALKDRNLHRRSKGQILLEMKLMWNPIRAAMRTFRPKEPKYMAAITQFQRKALAANLNRVKSYVAPFRHGLDYVQSCFAWDSPPRTVVAFILFILVTYNWHICMIPLLILALFGWSYLAKSGALGPREQSRWEKEYLDSADEEDECDESASDVDKNHGLADKLRGLQDKLLELQNGLDFIACTFERIRNVFTFAQPFLSVLAIGILIVGIILLYFIPFRYLVMAWGINKFSKRFRRKKGFTSNNEFMDYLSRIFSDKELRMYGEFYVHQQPPPDSKH